MTVYDKIRDEKLQYDINRQAAKILASSSEKNEKHNILQAKKYYPQIKEQVSFHILLLV